jgi:hypothetical protein
MLGKFQVKEGFIVLWLKKYQHMKDREEWFEILSSSFFVENCQHKENP